MQALKFQIRLFFALFFYVILVNSCTTQDSTTEIDPSTPGTITGTITPTDAAIRVACTPISGGQQTGLINPGGSFQIPAVVPGKYNVTIIPKVGYDAPSGVVITVPPGGNGDAGNFSLTSNGQTSSLSCLIDGTAFNLNYPQATLNYSSPNFELGGETNTSPTYWLFKIVLKNVNGPGTYNVTSAGSYIQLTHFSSPGTVDGNWSTNFGGTALINITELNTSTHTASGNFTATLLPQGVTGGGNKQITNGVFSNFNF